MKKNREFRKGAASFYIVAFSTLILMIVAASFAAVIVSEVTRTSNDDLSQSAYDSALAGVEDAKLAYYSYENCRGVDGKLPAATKPDSDNTITCGELVWYMQNPDCNMVGNMLGRSKNDVVGVEETNTGNSNNMQQYYTCVEIQDSLKDYRGTLSASSIIKVMRAKFDDEDVTDPASKIADKIKKVKISWYADTDYTGNLDEGGYTNINKETKKVTFPTLVNGKAATPPTISLAMVQTGLSFDINSFSMTQGEQTNRGMVYLVPAFDDATAKSNVPNNHYGTNYDSANHTSVIGASAFKKSNDKTVQNLPYTVYCGEANKGEFACSATIDLPRPIGDVRNSETFMFVVGLPYGKAGKSSQVTFALEFFCDDGVVCGTETVASEEEGETTQGTSQANLKGVQIEVDSTGRANDLFRRVETRLEDKGSFSLSIMGPLELLGDGSSDALKKDYAVKCEYNFGGPTCNDDGSPR